MGKTFKKILGFAAPIAFSFVPGLNLLGPALGSALGAGGAWAGTIGNALIGTGIGALTGGKQGALIGGLTGGISGYAKAGGFSDLFKSSTSLSSGNAGGLDESKWMTGTDQFGNSGRVPTNDAGYSRVVSGYGPNGQEIRSVLPEGNYITGSGAIFSDSSPFGYDLGSSGFDISGLNFNPGSILGGGSGNVPISELYTGTLSPDASSSISKLLGTGGAGEDQGSFLSRIANTFLSGGGNLSGLAGLLSGAKDIYSAYNARETANDIANDQRDAENRALDLYKQQYDRAYADFSPYREAGAQANTRLSQLLGLSGNAADPGYGTLTRNFSMNDFQVDPGYQFRLAEGNKALDRQQASRGGFYSGGALRAGERFGQDLASQEYNNAFNRFNTNNNNIYNRLSGVINTGIGATNSGVQSGNVYANQAGEGYRNIGNIDATQDFRRSDAFNQGLSSLMGSQYGGYRPYSPRYY